MGIPVIVYGKSGSGKTTSLRNFGNEEILYVNVEKKALPFRGNFKYAMSSENPQSIIGQLQRLGKDLPCKTAVIDDITYIMVNNFMRRHRDKKGNAQFELYNDIGDYIWSIFEAVRNLPEDVIVYIIMHEDTNDYGTTKIRTIGSLLDNKVVPEGIVTICLRAMTTKDGHVFRTVTDGSDITKAPIDMFSEDEIPNDLKVVDDTIREFYGIVQKKDKKERKEKNDKQA